MVGVSLRSPRALVLFKHLSLLLRAASESITSTLLNRMSSKTAKTPKISQFFSPTSKNGEMEGAKGKKRVVESVKGGSPKKARVQKTEKGGKKKKEKSAVKRASSAYIFFSKDFRDKLTEECKKKGETIPKVNEVAKLCGERWKQLSDEEKKPFQKLADLDKSRYQRETGKDAVKKDSDKPKRAPTAYFIFLADFRKKMANTEVEAGQKIPALAGEKWRSMGDKEREPYVKKEAEEKKKYEAAMEEYRKKMKDAPKAEKKSKPKKKEEPEEEEEEDEDEEEDDDDDDEDDDDDDDDDDE